jgi:hypothetical protein
MDTDKVTDERLQGWRNRLREETATPIFLIGVSHGQKSGQLVMCVPEGVDDDLLVGSLRFALQSLEANGGSGTKHHGERAVLKP